MTAEYDLRRFEGIICPHDRAVAMLEWLEYVSDDITREAKELGEGEDGTGSIDPALLNTLSKGLRLALSAVNELNCEGMNK
jgi:hypothetical protein